MVEQADSVRQVQEAVVVDVSRVEAAGFISLLEQVEQQGNRICEVDEAVVIDIASEEKISSSGAGASAFAAGDLYERRDEGQVAAVERGVVYACLLYTSPSPRDS